MKLLLFLLSFSFSALNASTLCMHHWQRDKETGKYQMHHIKHVQCSCPCTAPRNHDGTCQQCGHKVKMEPLHIKRKKQSSTD